MYRNSDTQAKIVLHINEIVCFKICRLEGYVIVCSLWEPTFRNNVMTPSSGLKISQARNQPAVRRLGWFATLSIRWYVPSNVGSCTDYAALYPRIWQLSLTAAVITSNITRVLCFYNFVSEHLSFRKLYNCLWLRYEQECKNMFLKGACYSCPDFNQILVRRYTIIKMYNAKFRTNPFCGSFVFYVYKRTARF
jgi:hypothetical protein